MSKFNFKGKIEVGNSKHKFEREVEAESQKHAEEKIYSELGSEHSVPRGKITIENSEEV